MPFLWRVSPSGGESSEPVKQSGSFGVPGSDRAPVKRKRSRV